MHRRAPGHSFSQRRPAVPAAPDFPPAPDRAVVKRALISVFDKTGLPALTGPARCSAPSRPRTRRTRARDLGPLRDAREARLACPHPSHLDRAEDRRDLDAGRRRISGCCKTAPRFALQGQEVVIGSACETIP